MSTEQSTFFGRFSLPFLRRCVNTFHPGTFLLIATSLPHRFVFLPKQCFPPPKSVINPSPSSRSPCLLMQTPSEARQLLAPKARERAFLDFPFPPPSIRRRRQIPPPRPAAAFPFLRAPPDETCFSQNPSSSLTRYAHPPLALARTPNSPPPPFFDDHPRRQRRLFPFFLFSTY